MGQSTPSAPVAPGRATAARARGVVAACAASAGAHAALVPEHLRESPRIGIAFVAATVLLLGVAVTLSLRPDDARAARAAAVVLGGLIVAYAASRTTGIPSLAPRPEPLDAVGVVTKLVEALGLVLALRLGQPAGERGSPAIKEVAG